MNVAVNNSPLSQPYASDALGRKLYAQNLIKLIDRLPKGVIAIDGEWGAGKSWFGEQLKIDIDQQAKHSTIWLDVFEADWDDDPALSLIAGIASQLPEETSNVLISKATPYLSRLIPIATKVLIKSAANYIGATDEVIDAAVASAEEGNEFLRKHLEDATNKRRNIQGIKNLLTQSIQATGKKQVIFVDELDRCSPKYAIQFMERLKHLFDLDDVIYILLWHRGQIHKSIETYYGNGTDGSMYLDKFIDYPLHLPLSQTSSSELPLLPLIRSHLNELSVNEQLIASDYINWIASVASILNLSAREVKRLIAWWVMSPNRQSPILEGWLLGLKVKKPAIFSGIRSGLREAHIEAGALLDLKPLDSHIQERFVSDLKQLHTRFASNNFGDLDPAFARTFTNEYSVFTSVVIAAMRRLELDFG
jgi:KAP family P-loop domain